MCLQSQNVCSILCFTETCTVTFPGLSTWSVLRNGHSQENNVGGIEVSNGLMITLVVNGFNNTGTEIL